MGTEGIQDKYINPYTDFGFKLLFGTAMNKEQGTSYQFPERASVQGRDSEGCHLFECGASGYAGV